MIYFMSESSELPVSRKENDRQAAEAVDYYVGRWCGDIYLTALDLFSRVKLLRETPIYLRDDLDIISGGLNRDGDPGIWIGLQERTLTSSMKSRVIERFDLSNDYFIAPNYNFMPFIFAHELGHVIQADRSFERIFGAINNELLIPETNYAAYVNSDVELNADYIAAVIVGNSEYGIEAGFMPPAEEPLRWREWAATHPIPETIAANS